MANNLHKPSEKTIAASLINEEKYHEMYKKAVVELFNNYREIYDPKAGDVEFI